MYRLLLASFLILALVLVNAARPTSFQNRAVHSVGSSGEGNSPLEVRPRETLGLVYRSSNSAGSDSDSLSEDGYYQMLADNDWDPSRVKTTHLLPQVKELWKLLHPLFFPVSLHYLRDLMGAFDYLAPRSRKYHLANLAAMKLDLSYHIFIQAVRNLVSDGIHNPERIPEGYYWESQTGDIANELRNAIYVGLMKDHARGVVNAALGLQTNGRVLEVVLAAYAVFRDWERLCDNLYPQYIQFRNGKDDTHKLYDFYISVVEPHLPKAPLQHPQSKSS